MPDRGPYLASRAQQIDARGEAPRSIYFRPSGEERCAICSLRAGRVPRPGDGCIWRALVQKTSWLTTARSSTDRPSDISAYRGSRSEAECFQPLVLGRRQVGMLTRIAKRSVAASDIGTSSPRSTGWRWHAKLKAGSRLVVFLPSVSVRSCNSRTTRHDLRGMRLIIEEEDFRPILNDRISVMERPGRQVENLETDDPVGCRSARP